MFRETWDKKMSETPDIQTCARAIDLVAYLYGEATEREAQDFKGHLLVCTTCRAELNDFADVRESIGLWREQALSPAASPATQFNPAPAQRILVSEPRRSFFDMLRDLFTVSPMWMRGATAFTTLLLASLLVIALVRLFNQAETPLVQNPQPQPAAPFNPGPANAPKTPEDEFVKVVPQENPAPVAPVIKIKRPKSYRNLKANGNTMTANRQSTQPKATQVLTPEERTQLSELLIPRAENEDTVPRLSDLLGETN